ncbi:ABC transporter ATP-binding protein [Kineothrix sp. MB12-C1]|uniref:ABC transporter ATP-binding protein n=1 Tax=Kineothrix sp. MB12-C1 TaxID=3070215 RepID=UPI0027D2412B|nr:ATP-binding cassette domain-containing protein [Kineothrix sp. MB12-C1]WMC93417.1 ATP-binding cassette domain-containing protein [Kineothrix sp. MB12-C1]
MKEEFIIMDHVSFSFGPQKVLSDICLTLEQGASYALIGKSGSGKTTMLNLLAGFLKPEQGRVCIRGKEVAEPREETAFLFQELGLFPWQTVSEAVAMPLLLRGKKQGVKEISEELLRRVGLEACGNKYPYELSGGERQRVALARTLIGEPDIILMDEPTSALDAVTKETLQELIIQEQRKQEATLFFVTHDVEEAMMLGQYILILREDGTTFRVENPYYFTENAKEQLGFYEECIKLRRWIK